MTGSIASTIQGEAGSDPAAQFAVASTIFNRMKLGTFPGGSAPEAIVNAPSQYVGNAIPNSSAQTFAQAIIDGTLPQYGNTGNAVNFQSGQTAVRNGLTQGGTNIGGNFFSDNLGPPSSGYVAPSFGGSTDVGGGGTVDFSTTPIGDPSLQGGTVPDATSLGIDNSASTGGVFDPNTGLGTGAFDGGSAVGGAATDAVGSAAGGIGDAVSGAAGAITGGLTGMAGIPQAIIKAGSTVGQGVANGIGTAVNSTITAAQDYFKRGGVMILAIVLVLAAAYMLVPRGAKESIASGAMGGGGRIPRSGGGGSGGGSRRPAMIRPGEAGYVSPAQLAAGRAAHGIT